MSSYCICDEHLEITADGVLCVVPGAFGPRLTLTYRASGQFRKAAYPWLARVYVRVVGGGGAGGGTQATSSTEAAAGGGGGGGGAAEALVDVASLADIETITVGLGGVGVSESSGGDGGFSAFGPHAVATGGTGGGFGSENPNTFQTLLAAGLPGTAGQGTVGDVLHIGGSGDFGLALGSTNILGKAGAGGGSLLAGRRGGRTTDGVGQDGVANTGQGGSGACGRGEQPAEAGGSGGSGLVVVVLYG